MARAGGQDRGLFIRDGWWWIQYHHQGAKHREKVAPVELKGSKAKARARYLQRKEECRTLKFDPEAVSRRGSEPAITVGELVDHYLPECLRSLRQPRDAQRYAAFWAEKLADVPAKDLKPGQVEAVRAELLERGRRRERGGQEVGSSVRPATVNRHVAFLSRVYALAIRDDLVVTNPCKKLRKLQENNTRTRSLSPEEQLRLQAEMEPRHWRLVELAIQTGMRRAELFGLRREHVNLAAGFAMIPRSKHGEHRFVALSSRARAILSEVLAEHSSEWVFPNRAGRQLDANNFVHRVFVPALEKAGIRDFQWHCLRHTFASRLTMQGQNAITVQELGGWKTLEMVKRYSHLSPGHLLEAVEGLSGPAPGTDTETDTGRRVHVQDPAQVEGFPC